MDENKFENVDSGTESQKNHTDREATPPHQDVSHDDLKGGHAPIQHAMTNEEKNRLNKKLNDIT